MMTADPEREPKDSQLRRSRVQIESAHREGEFLLAQIRESQRTIERSRELIARLDELLNRLNADKD